MQTNGRHISSADLAMRYGLVHPRSREDAPILRTREQIEGSVALLTEVLGLLDVAMFYDDCAVSSNPLAGTIIPEIEGARDEIVTGLASLGMILCQNGDVLTVGYNGKDSESEQRHSSKLLSEVLVTTEAGADGY